MDFTIRVLTSKDAENLFREAVHEVTVGDNEPVYRIPKQCKISCSIQLFAIFS